MPKGVGLRNYGQASAIDILAFSDRIAVLYEGEIMGVVNRSETNAEELGLMMAGERQEHLAEAKAAA